MRKAPLTGALSKVSAQTRGESPNYRRAARHNHASQQLALFIEDDRPERELGFIYNPSAPATDEDLTEFFREMKELLTDTKSVA